VSEEPPRPYRPVALWFMGAVVAVIGLGILGEQVKRWAGSAPPAPAPAPPAPPSPAPDPAKAMTFVLRGTVRGPDGKTPVPRAVLDVVPRGGRRELLAADGNGAFAWRSMQSTPAAVIWAAAPGVGLGHVFVQGAPGREMEQDVILVPARPQPVSVKNASGEPAAKASVHAEVAGEDAPLLPAASPRGTAGSDGRCTLDVPPGLPLRFHAVSADGSGTGETEVKTAPGPDAAVEIVLRPKVPDGR
jgi:hypothetical protein